MQAAAKLVRQIREAIATGGQHAPLEAYAADYARWCREAGERLDSCGTMLANGSEFQALQLAETEPPLLDLLAVLSFAEARDWTDYCRAHAWPVAARFDAKAVMALDALYAKGIAANHPLYKDYRAAVTLRDDGKAIQIIRSIARLNPQDPNAQAELARLENKLYQAGLQDLRAALEAGAEAAIVNRFDELERLAPAEKLAGLPEVLRALEVRQSVDRRDAMERVKQLLETLAGERAAGAWRMVGELLGRVEALQTAHGFALSAADTAQVVELRRYFEAERDASAERARFDKAQEAVLALLNEIPDRRAAARSPVEIERLQSEVRGRWDAVAGFNRTSPEELATRVAATIGELELTGRRLQRLRRFRGALLALVIALAAGTFGWAAMRVYRERDYAQQLIAAQQTGRVETAERLIAFLKTEQPALSSRPTLQRALEDADRWARDERSKLAGVEAWIAGLDLHAAKGFTESDPEVVQTEIETGGRLAASLAEGLRASLEARLAAIRERFAHRVEGVRGKRFADAEKETQGLELVAAEKLTFESTRPELTGALEQIEPALRKLEAQVDSPIAALKLPGGLAARIAALRERANLFGSELALIGRVNEALLQAQNLEAYRAALDGFKASRLAQVDEVQAARRMVASFPDPDMLFANLLLPGDAAGWSAARTDAGRELFAPVNVLPAEITRLLALRDDSLLNNIWEMTLTDFTRKHERRTVYSRGEMKKDGPREVGDGVAVAWSGAICDPATGGSVAAFVPVTLTMLRTSTGATGSGEITGSRRSAVSECLARLELNRMTDADGLKYERPLLRVFDELAREKDANVIFKAFMMQQLGALVLARPVEWGLNYCPSLRRDLARLTELCGEDVLRSGDWLLERKRTQWASKFAPFFQELQSRNYLAEARLARTMVQAALKAGLQFGGYVDGGGRPRWLGETAAADICWALPEDGKSLAPIRREPPETTKPFARFSPIFYVPLKRAELLAEAQRKIAGPASAPPPPPDLPFLADP